MSVSLLQAALNFRNISHKPCVHIGKKIYMREIKSSQRVYIQKQNSLNFLLIQLQTHRHRYGKSSQLVERLKFVLQMQKGFLNFQPFK